MNSSVVRSRLLAPAMCSSLVLFCAAGPATGDPVWQQSGLPGGCVADVEFHAASSDTVYGGCESPQGFFLSVDGGLSWDGLGPDHNVRAIAVNPFNTQQMYVAGWEGVYKSNDRGETWNRKMNGLDFHSGDDWMQAICVNPAHPETLLAGKATYFGNAELYRSSNRAQQWELLDLGIPPDWTWHIYDIEYDPIDPATVFVGLDHSLVRSEDGGDSFSQIIVAVGLGFEDIAIDPLNPDNVYVACSASPAHGGGGVYRSADGGDSWQLLQSESGMSSPWVRAIAVDPVNPMNLYAGTGDSSAVFRSVDGGDSWTLMRDGLPAAPVRINRLAAGPETGALLIAATQADGFYRVDLSTASWVRGGEYQSFRVALAQNYPNPFNPVTRIEYSLPSPSRVVLGIYNVEGRLVRTLVDGTVGRGRHEACWDGKDERGRDVRSGVYFYRIETDGSTLCRKMVLAR